MPLLKQSHSLNTLQHSCISFSRPIAPLHSVLFLFSHPCRLCATAPFSPLQPIKHATNCLSHTSFSVGVPLPHRCQPTQILPHAPTKTSPHFFCLGFPSTLFSLQQEKRQLHLSSDRYPPSTFLLSHLLPPDLTDSPSSLPRSSPSSFSPFPLPLPSSLLAILTPPVSSADFPASLPRKPSSISNLNSLESHFPTLQNVCAR